MFVMGILMFFIAPVFWTILGMSPTHIENVECYDRWNNEIIGVTCEEEVYNDKYAQIISEYIEFTFFPIIFGLMILVLAMIS